MDEKRFGVCRLTGTRGKLVKCHLLPRAFTKPTEPGAPLLQAEHRLPITIRRDSWYDPGIVTRAGEDILGRIDDAAIKELRKHRLVWSGWGDARELECEHHHTIIPPSHGIRMLRGVNARVLRAFCMSLLWRAAVTTRFEFSEVVLPEEDVAQIGELLLSGEWGPVDFYPATPIQLSTLGLPHNLSPLATTKLYPSVGGSPEWSVNLFRFYIDGLAIHVHNHASDNGETVRLGSTIIGASDELWVTTVTYDQSFEAENFEEGVSHSLFPDFPRPGGGQWPAGPGPRTKPPRGP